MGKQRRRYGRKRSELLNSDLKSFFMGVGVGIIGMALSPQLRDTVIPLTDSVVTNLKGYTGHIEEIKERFQDMVAEAKFESVKKTIDNEISGDKTNE